MILKSFGCSFIFGSDLADDGRNGPKPTPSQYTWPANIARDKGLDYQCYARPGAGNLQILEQVLNQVNDTQPSIFVIGWSWIDRFDYYDKDWDHRYKLSPWSTIMPVDDTALAKTYYKHLHSQYQDKLTTLIYIKSAIDMLKEKQIPFLMTYMDELIFETEWHCTPAILELQEAIKPHMRSFNGQTFLEWSRSQGFEISEQLHPLEPAHLAAAELIKSYNLV